MTRILAFEWRRASSLRSTWVFLALGISLNAALALGAFLLGAATPAAGGLAAQQQILQVAVDAGNPLGIVLMTTICAQAFGHDYRDGTMRLVLSEYPARIPVFAAKLLVPATLVAAAMLLTEFIAIGAALTGVGIGAPEDWVALAAVAARAVVLVVWWGLLVAAITALLRNLAAGIVVALLMATILEALVRQLLGDRLPWLADNLPFSSALDWELGGGAAAGAAAVAWAGATVAAALVLFQRRDA